MDFGSAVCIPKTPRCGECPIVNMCAAYQHEDTDKLPVRIKKTKVVEVPLFVGILNYKGYYLLHKRPNRGLLRSMWEFPSVEMISAFEDGERGLEELVQALGFELSLQPVLVKEITHIFSHRKWFMKAFRGDLTYTGDANNILIADIQQQLPKDWMLIKRDEFSDYAWAGPHGKLTEIAK